jgi:hypothetical protein
LVDQNLDNRDSEIEKTSSNDGDWWDISSEKR